MEKIGCNRVRFLSPISISLADMQSEKLPGFLAPLFWDTDFTRLQLADYETYIIERVLEYGDDRAIVWLRHTFIPATIARVVRQSRRISLNTANLWTLVLDIPKETIKCFSTPSLKLRGSFSRGNERTMIKKSENTNLPIYLDYNATTPIDPRVAEAMTPYLYEHFGNPSSPHPYGVTTKRAVERARRQVAELLGGKPAELFFTSGGTESNNTAIKGVAAAYRDKGNHIITSAVEHPAVLEPCEHLRDAGYRVTVLPVDEYGQVNLADVEKAITAETILVSVMHANNEVGTIQPIAEIAAMAHQAGALMHTDAAQSVGKIPVRVDELGVDLLSVAGHKLYAPKGVGALYVREGVQLPKFMHGASHEGNRRAGTENVLEIVGLGAAAEIVRQELAQNTAHLRQMRDRLWEGLSARLEEIKLNGHPTERLPNTLSVSFRGIEADDLLAKLWDEVAASAGAACHSAGVIVSTVLQAMDIPLEFAMGTLRFSTGRFTTVEEINRAVEVVIAAVGRVKTDK